MRHVMLVIIKKHDRKLNYQAQNDAHYEGTKNPTEMNAMENYMLRVCAWECDAFRK
jgi:hypothetical protein